jgi:hypothetical protein
LAIKEVNNYYTGNDKNKAKNCVSQLLERTKAKTGTGFHL